MKSTLKMFMETGGGGTIGFEELDHVSDMVYLAVRGTTTDDIFRATGEPVTVPFIGDHDHLHSTWLAHNTADECFWRDTEAGWMWMVIRPV